MLNYTDTFLLNTSMFIYLCKQAGIIRNAFLTFGTNENCIADLFVSKLWHIWMLSKSALKGSNCVEPDQSLQFGLDMLATV